jgi:hypothetical protein
VDVSLSLHWEPVVAQPAHNLGGHPLKGLLCRAFGEHDGSLSEQFFLREEDQPILRALRRVHADHPEIAEGLTEVIDAISAHGTLRLWTGE